MTPITDEDHSDGPAHAHAVLVEYGDFQCPTCGQAEPILREVRERIGDQLRFVFRNFPLTDIHPYAMGAAEAAEAADAQGQFWAMHDLLLANQGKLGRSNLEDYAEGIGLDMDAFRKALDGHVARRGIEQGARDGVDSGVQGTPTLFLNGKLYEGSFDAASIIQAASA